MAKTSNAGPGDKVELADKDTGFSDPATGFDIVRDQQKKLGDTIGSKTQTALLSGRLLVVGRSKATAKAEEPETDGLDIPQDLPGRDAFIAEGFTTFDSIKELDSEEKLLAIKGIGAVTVKNLAAWAAANPPTSVEGED